MNRDCERVDVRLDTGLELLLEHAPADALRVLATVVATCGSTYRKPGARMLIMADGSFVGLLSGGCLEADLMSHAQDVLRSGVARAIEYDMRGPDEVLFGVGTGCEGAMRVLLEPAAHDGATARALASASRASCDGLPAALVLVHESDNLKLGTYEVTAPLPDLLSAAVREALASNSSVAIDAGIGSERTRALVQLLAPTPHLLVCGAGPDAIPVVGSARALGWRVTVVDHRPAYTEAGRFSGAKVLLADADALQARVDLQHCHAAVVMSHHFASDTAYLREFAAAGKPGYVGLLGPAARRMRLLQELGAAAKQIQGRLRSPVGLDVGALTPEAIALSIVTQIHAWLAGRC